ncbi:MAG: protein kinase domain-containing protein [Chlamydiia bacterium]
MGRRLARLTPLPKLLEEGADIPLEHEGVSGPFKSPQLDRIAKIGNRVLFVTGEAFAHGGLATVHRAMTLESPEPDSYQPSGELSVVRSQQVRLSTRPVAIRRGSPQEISDRARSYERKFAFEMGVHRRAHRLAPAGVINLMDSRIQTRQMVEPSRLPMGSRSTTTTEEVLVTECVLEQGDMSLSSWLRNGQRESINVEVAAAQLLETLAVLHRNGIVHLDLKPDNILLVKDEQGAYRLKLCDFGCANDLSFLQAERTHPEEWTVACERAIPNQNSILYTASEIREIGLGNPDGIPGLPLYEGGEVPTKFTDDHYIMGPRYDVFSLGVVLWQMATDVGLPLVEARTKRSDFWPAPFSPDDYQALKEMVQQNSSLRANPLICTALKCLTPMPLDRPSDAGKVLKILQNFQSQIGRSPFG